MSRRELFHGVVDCNVRSEVYCANYLMCANYGNLEFVITRVKHLL
jgi:hypothetical protein